MFNLGLAAFSDGVFLVREAAKICLFPVDVDASTPYMISCMPMDPCDSGCIIWWSPRISTLFTLSYKSKIFFSVVTTACVNVIDLFFMSPKFVSLHNSNVHKNCLSLWFRKIGSFSVTSATFSDTMITPFPFREPLEIFIIDDSHSVLWQFDQFHWIKGPSSFQFPNLCENSLEVINC